jgi:hypothetical protein
MPDAVPPLWPHVRQFNQDEHHIAAPGFQLRPPKVCMDDSRLECVAEADSLFARMPVGEVRQRTDGILQRGGARSIPCMTFCPDYVADYTNRTVISGRAEGAKLELICYSSLDRAEIQ